MFFFGIDSRLEIATFWEFTGVGIEAMWEDR
jgi:hypothetical protein